MSDSLDTDQQLDDASPTDVLSVTELNKQIASVVKNTVALHDARCIGEVTNLSQSNTALYFTLTDGDAELPCLLWTNRYQNMDVSLEDGTEVILEGNIDYWIEGGKIDLKPWDITVLAMVNKQMQLSDCALN